MKIPDMKSLKFIFCDSAGGKGDFDSLRVRFASVIFYSNDFIEPRKMKFLEGATATRNVLYDTQGTHAANTTDTLRRIGSDILILPRN